MSTSHTLAWPALATTWPSSGSDIGKHPKGGGGVPTLFPRTRVADVYSYKKFCKVLQVVDFFAVAGEVLHLLGGWKSHFSSP